VPDIAAILSLLPLHSPSVGQRMDSLSDLRIEYMSYSGKKYCTCLARDARY
jgi:hypothetical protein